MWANQRCTCVPCVSNPTGKLGFLLKAVGRIYLFYFLKYQSPNSLQRNKTEELPHKKKGRRGTFRRGISENKFEEEKIWNGKKGVSLKTSHISLSVTYEGTLEVRGCSSTQRSTWAETDPRGYAGRQNRRENWYGKEVKTKKANSDWAKGQGKAKCNSRKRDRSQRHQGVTTG